MSADASRIDSPGRVMSELLQLYSPEVAEQWLHGVNPHVGDRRPIDLLNAGCCRELLDAITEERAGSFV